MTDRGTLQVVDLFVEYLRTQGDRRSWATKGRGALVQRIATPHNHWKKVTCGFEMPADVEEGIVEALRRIDQAGDTVDRALPGWPGLEGGDRARLGKLVKTTGSGSC